MEALARQPRWHLHLEVCKTDLPSQSCPCSPLSGCRVDSPGITLSCLCSSPQTQAIRKPCCAHLQDMPSASPNCATSWAEPQRARVRLTDCNSPASAFPRLPQPLPWTLSSQNNPLKTAATEVDPAPPLFRTLPWRSPEVCTVTNKTPQHLPTTQPCHQPHSPLLPAPASLMINHVASWHPLPQTRRVLPQGSALAGPSCRHPWLPPSPNLIQPPFLGEAHGDPLPNPSALSPLACQFSFPQY